MFFFENYTLEAVLTIIGLILLLLLVNEITRRSKWAAICCYIIAPIVLTIFLWPKSAGAGTSGGYWFAWVKTYSALAGVIGFMAIRYIKRVGNNKYALYFPFAILTINIIEAIFRDIEVFSIHGEIQNGIFLQGGPWNIINAIAGIFLVLSLTGWAGIRIAKTKSKDMIWADQLWFWIIAYDLWNIAYCYNCISNRAMYAGVVILVACTVAEIFKRGAWLQHRAMTLALWAMFSLSYSYADDKLLFGVTSTHNTNALLVLSVLALIANVSMFGYQVYKMIKTKRNPIIEDLNIDLKAYQKNLSANGLV
ncbi:hypothetical protein KHQ81_12325 [Mycoplasmatota bacterium]|nr:hypothetical protein KHQ81_12325 [Mycoplasmatota bacterium]